VVSQAAFVGNDRGAASDASVTWTVRAPHQRPQPVRCGTGQGPARTPATTTHRVQLQAILSRWLTTRARPARRRTRSMFSSAPHTRALGGGIQDSMGQRAPTNFGGARPRRDSSCRFVTAGGLGKRKPGEACRQTDCRAAWSAGRHPSRPATFCNRRPNRLSGFGVGLGSPVLLG
jgi:hypothetical protein